MWIFHACVKSDQLLARVCVLAAVKLGSKGGVWLYAGGPATLGGWQEAC